eukprot:365728-Chlamydomonas_euryale.AAC.2
MVVGVRAMLCNSAAHVSPRSATSFAGHVAPACSSPPRHPVAGLPAVGFEWGTAIQVASHCREAYMYAGCRA